MTPALHYIRTFVQCQESPNPDEKFSVSPPSVSLTSAGLPSALALPSPPVLLPHCGWPSPPAPLPHCGRGGWCRSAPAAITSPSSPRVRAEGGWGGGEYNLPPSSPAAWERKGGGGDGEGPCDDHLPFLAPCESGRGDGEGVPFSTPYLSPHHSVRHVWRSNGSGRCASFCLPICTCHRW